MKDERGLGEKSGGNQEGSGSAREYCRKCSIREKTLKHYKKKEKNAVARLGKKKNRGKE